MQGSKLFVGNLSYSVTEKDLEDLFANHGEVKYTKVIDGKGFGFVEMSSQSEAEEAKDALNSTEFQGRSLRVDEAHPPKSRERGGYQRY
jgi:RNA recognition motif-containing protein